MAAGCVIGVDLGGTKLLAGAVDRDLQVHHRAFRRSRAGADAEAVIDVIVDAVEEARAAAATEVRAVGFGIPSLVDQRTGRAVTTVHLPLRDVPFRDVMAERLGVPVVVDNDANAALVAEHRRGAAQGAAHAVLLTLGTGIGSAMVVDGRLVRGAVGAAGEWGHTVVDVDGPRCSCGSHGCLEVLVSGSAVGRAGARAAARWPSSALGRAASAGREITGMLVTELAHDGDAAARSVVEEVGRLLGLGIVNVVNVLNPEVVVVGGGAIGAGELLLEPAREVVAARALAPSRDVVAIRPAHFGDASGMLGAALLAMDALDGGAAAQERPAA